jgi:tetratricopeptide (TPR) repeat protein
MRRGIGRQERSHGSIPPAMARSAAGSAAWPRPGGMLAGGAPLTAGSLTLLLAVAIAGAWFAPGSPAKLSAAAPVSAGGRQDPLLDRWLAAVSHHAPGREDAETLLIGSWPIRDVEAVIDGARNGRLADGPDRNALLLRGALLHTDIARFGPSPPAGRPDVALARDGRYEGMASSIHWDFARAFLDQVSPHPSKDPGVRLWYRAVAAHMVSEARLGDAVSHLRRAVRLLPADRDILFAVGCMRESLAAPDRQAVMDAVRQPALPSMGRFGITDGPIDGPSAEVGSASDELGKAERAFRAALDVDPAFADARLHLGRVLGLRGQARTAADELARIPESSEPVLRYCAALFLGRQHEALGDPAAARDDYRRAAALYPRAQSPHLATSALARRSGDRTGANAAIAPLLALPADAAARDDPWWAYGRGPRNGDELVREMYRVLGGGTR